MLTQGKSAAWKKRRFPYYDEVDNPAAMTEDKQGGTNSTGLSVRDESDQNWYLGKTVDRIGAGIG